MSLRTSYCFCVMPDQGARMTSGSSSVMASKSISSPPANCLGSLSPDFFTASLIHGR
ncbi:hypothetical protein SCYAM73S_00373 [Streptomyces cyaneofuscatus]